MKQKILPIGKVAFHALALLILISAESNIGYAVLNSINDGWTETDDPYATGTDTITFSSGGLDQRYTFDASSSADMYCIEVNNGFQRSHSYFIDGIEWDNVNMYSPRDYTDGGYRKTIQPIGGTASQCRFYYWIDRPSVCDGIYFQGDSAAYASAGCPVDLIGNIAEGVTQNYNVSGVPTQITCLMATSASYIKCQAATSTDLSDCIDDSFNGVNGGDSTNLYETCFNNQDTGYDTEYTCDVDDPTNNWEISLFDENHLSSLMTDLYASGIPNGTFRLYEYDFCGTASFDRNLISTFNLTQFQTKAVVKNGVYEYNATGFVRGYFPWFGISGYQNNSYAYGENICSLGLVSINSSETSSDNFDLDSVACFNDGGSCYDGSTNQDEQTADYGGVCGLCDNSSAVDDLYFSVAYQSHPSGYFDSHYFDVQDNCSEGEDAVNFSVVFALFVQITLFVLLIALLLIFVYLIVVNSVGYLAIKIYNELKNNSNGKQERKLLNKTDNKRKR